MLYDVSVFPESGNVNKERSLGVCRAQKGIFVCHRVNMMPADL